MLWKKYIKKYTMWKSVYHVDKGHKVIYGVNLEYTIK